jgi:RNA polymerase sigma factor (sigma-70 family)
MQFPAAYVRSMVTNGYLSGKRRWSERFISSTRSGELPELAVPAAARSVDDRDQLDQLLRALPQQQRAAIVLRYYFDLTDETIAAELRCSAGAVRSYISRGLRAVREREHEPDRGPEPLLTPLPQVGRANPVGEPR